MATTTGELLDAPPDAFVREGNSPARLHVTAGAVTLNTMMDAQFGTGFELDLSGLEPLNVDSARRIARG